MKPDVTLAVEGSIQHHQFTLPTMVDHTPYHDWEAKVTICWLDACIYQSLPLPAVHMSTTITVKQHEARLITEHTASSAWGSTFCAFFPTHGGIVCDPMSIWDTWWNTLTDSQQPKACLPCSELITSSKIGGSSQWPFELTFRLHGLWSNSSDFQFLGCITKFCWWILVAQHPCHFSLRIALSRQSYKPYQCLLLKITWHDALKEWYKMQINLARHPCSIEPSMCLADFTQRGSNLDDFHSSQLWCCTVLLPLVWKNTARNSKW